MTFKTLLSVNPRPPHASNSASQNENIQLFFFLNENMVNFNLSRKTSTCRYTYNARIVNPSLGYRDVQNKSRSLMYIDQHKKQKYIWLRGRDTCTDKDGGRGSGPHLENSNFIKLT